MSGGFQGGPYCLLFTAQGSKPLDAVAVTGSAKTEYDAACKSSVVTLAATTAGSRLVLPKAAASIAGQQRISGRPSSVQGYSPSGFIQHGAVVVQAFVPQGAPFYVEFVVADTSGQRRRMLFSTSCTAAAVEALHVKLPLTTVPRNVWTELCFDVAGVTASVATPQFARAAGLTSKASAVAARRPASVSSHHFASAFGQPPPPDRQLRGRSPPTASTFRGIEAITIGSQCRLRRVYSLRELSRAHRPQDVSHASQNTSGLSEASHSIALPSVFAFPPAVDVVPMAFSTGLEGIDGRTAAADAVVAGTPRPTPSTGRRPAPTDASKNPSAFVFQDVAAHRAKSETPPRAPLAARQEAPSPYDVASAAAVQAAQAAANAPGFRAPVLSPRKLPTRHVASAKRPPPAPVATKKRPAALSAGARPSRAPAGAAPDTQPDLGLGIAGFNVRQAHSGAQGNEHVSAPWSRAVDQHVRHPASADDRGTSPLPPLAPTLSGSRRSEGGSPTLEVQSPASRSTASRYGADDVHPAARQRSPSPPPAFPVPTAGADFGFGAVDDVLLRRAAHSLMSAATHTESPGSSRSVASCPAVVDHSGDGSPLRPLSAPRESQHSFGRSVADAARAMADDAELRTLQGSHRQRSHSVPAMLRSDRNARREGPAIEVPSELWASGAHASVRGSSAQCPATDDDSDDIEVFEVFTPSNPGPAAVAPQEHSVLERSSGILQPNIVDVASLRASAALALNRPGAAEAAVVSATSATSATELTTAVSRSTSRPASRAIGVQVTAADFPETDAAEFPPDSGGHNVAAKEQSDESLRDLSSVGHADVTTDLDGTDAQVDAAALLHIPLTPLPDGGRVLATDSMLAAHGGDQHRYVMTGSVGATPLSTYGVPPPGHLVASQRHGVSASIPNPALASGLGTDRSQPRNHQETEGHRSRPGTGGQRSVMSSGHVDPTAMSALLIDDPHDAAQDHHDSHSGSGGLPDGSVDECVGLGGTAVTVEIGGRPPHMLDTVQLGSTGRTHGGAGADEQWVRMSLPGAVPSPEYAQPPVAHGLPPPGPSRLSGTARETPPEVAAGPPPQRALMSSNAPMDAVAAAALCGGSGRGFCPSPPRDVDDSLELGPEPPFEGGPSAADADDESLVWRGAGQWPPEEHQVSEWRYAHLTVDSSVESLLRVSCASDVPVPTARAGPVLVARPASSLAPHDTPGDDRTDTARPRLRSGGVSVRAGTAASGIGSQRIGTAASVREVSLPARDFQAPGAGAHYPPHLPPPPSQRHLLGSGDAAAFQQPSLAPDRPLSTMTGADVSYDDDGVEFYDPADEEGASDDLGHQPLPVKELTFTAAEEEEPLPNTRRLSGSTAGVDSPRQGTGTWRGSTARTAADVEREMTDRSPWVGDTTGRYQYDPLLQCYLDTVTNRLIYPSEA